MKRAVKVPVTFESRLTTEELEQKIEEEMSSDVWRENDLKGRQIYLWRLEGDNVEVKYFHSYRSDMCDTMFQGTLNKGLQGSQLDGFIKKPATVWAIFWVIIGITLLVTAALLFAVGFSAEPELGLLLVFPLILLVVAFIEANLLRFEKKRLANLNNYLREFTSAENTDVLGEELDSERD